MVEKQIRTFYDCWIVKKNVEIIHISSLSLVALWLHILKQTLIKVSINLRVQVISSLNNINYVNNFHIKFL